MRPGRPRRQVGAAPLAKRRVLPLGPVSDVETEERARGGGDVDAAGPVEAEARRLLGPNDLALLVAEAPRATSAKGRLRSPEEVAGLLRWLIDVRKGAPQGAPSLLDV